MDRKVCLTCGKDADEDSFRYLSGKIGPWCKECREEHSLKGKKAYERRYNKKYYESHIEENVSKRLKKYGIDLSQYNQMLFNQGGVCAICGEPEVAKYKGRTKPLSVDHCHETDKIRGLLCNSCNKGIGFLKDDIDIMASAISYLQQE